MIALVEQPFKCTHCGKSFMKDRTLISHLCERKRRALQKDEKRVQTGYYTFNRFWQLTQNSKKNKTYDEFADSSYYNAFVKFGSYINNVNPIYPDKFIDYIIKSGIKLDHWTKDSHYEKYLQEMLKVEPVESAVQRTIQTMIEWSDEQNAKFTHYFNYVSLNRAVQDIITGKISCWVILNTKAGKDMIQKMNDEQVALIAPVFDVKYWLKKFKENPADKALVLEICEKIGLN